MNCADPEKDMKLANKKKRVTGQRQCPRCSARNVRSCLELYQITDVTAVFLCSNQHCLFRREVRRDYAVLHRLQGKQGEDEDHREKTAALKDWTFEGKKAVDSFKCPMSFKEGSPDEARAVLQQAVCLLGAVMGKEPLPGDAGLSCHQAGLCHRDQEEEEEELDAVEALMRDHAELAVHKDACRTADFVVKVEEDFRQLEGDLRRLKVEVPVYRQKVDGKYSTVDAAELFRKWLGDRFDFVERHGPPCGVIDLSDGSSAESVQRRECDQDHACDPLDVLLGETQCGEWDPNDSFVIMFQEGATESAVLMDTRLEETTCP